MERAKTAPDVARVDYAVDEQGNPIELPKDSTLKVASELDPSIGGTTPANWWRYGLVVLAVIAGILLALQFLGGNKGTDVVPGTPVAAPQTNADSQ
jgi:hypothetical protein